MDKGMDSWSQRTAFVGFDWASDHHDVVLVERHGKVVEEFRFDDTAEGWQLLIKKLRNHPDPAVAIETSSGATVERLLEAGYAVYPVNPKSATESAKLPAEPRVTVSMLGASRIPCGLTGTLGGASSRTIR